jgi:hypothetical protein
VDNKARAQQARRPADRGRSPTILPDDCQFSERMTYGQMCLEIASVPFEEVQGVFRTLETVDEKGLVH